MGWLSQISTALGFPAKAVEGQYRPGPYQLPITGGWLPAGTPWNFWQCGIDPANGCGASAMVEACVGAYAQTVAMLPGDHWRKLANGGRERVVTSALNRILRKPNDYQSISDFLLNGVRSLYLDGNLYALALRNDRREVDSLHLFNPRSSFPSVAETGDVFYGLQGNVVIDRLRPPTERLVVPARDVLHIRLNANEGDPLRGRTPLEAAMLDVAASGAMSAQQVAFYRNQSRPSQVLLTDAPLTKDQVTSLRDAWNAQSQGLAQGGTPILSHGLKPQTLAMSSVDAQLAEMMKLSDQHVALTYRVPLQILGIGGTPYASTELLMQSWIASGLGFALNHLEEAIGLFFGLKGQPDEYLEFNTQALLRSAYKDRIEALARGVQGGLIAPDEGRAELEYPKVPGGAGEEPRVQQQVVPLSAWDRVPPATPRPDAPPAAPPAAANSDAADGSDDAEATAKLIEIVARDTARRVFRDAA